MTSSHLWNNFITINSLACSFWNTVFLSQFFFFWILFFCTDFLKIFFDWGLLSAPIHTFLDSFLCFRVWKPIFLRVPGQLVSGWTLPMNGWWGTDVSISPAILQRASFLPSAVWEFRSFPVVLVSTLTFFSGVPSKYLLCCSTVSGVSSSQEASPLHCGLQGNKPLPLIPQQCRSRLFHAVSNVLSTKLFPFALLGLPTSVQPVLGIKFSLFEIHKVFSALFSLNIFLKPVFGSLYRSVIKYRMQYLIHNYTKILFIAYYFELDVLYYYLLNLIAIWLYSLSTCSFYYGKGVAYTADRDVLLVAFCMRFSTYFLR